MVIRVDRFAKNMHEVGNDLLIVKPHEMPFNEDRRKMVPSVRYNSIY